MSCIIRACYGSVYNPLNWLYTAVYSVDCLACVGWGRPWGCEVGRKGGFTFLPLGFSISSWDDHMTDDERQAGSVNMEMVWDQKTT